MTVPYKWFETSLFPHNRVEIISDYHWWLLQRIHVIHKLDLPLVSYYIPWIIMMKMEMKSTRMSDDQETIQVEVID